MTIVGVIPARWASTRFPGKPLALIGGRTLVARVIERGRMAHSLSEVVVATDDERIASEARKFCRVEMTDPGHRSGTDRVAEVAGRMDCDGVVNIQGDEPLVDPEVIDTVARGLESAGMTTAAAPVTNRDHYRDPAMPKVVVSRSGHALYFSRRTIPCLYGTGKTPEQPWEAHGFLRHIGIYGYRREILSRLVSLPPSPLERAERLEQLRAIENDLDIRVFRVESAGVGVDRPEDVARVEALLIDHA